MVLSQGRVSLEQRLGTALQTATFLILSLSFSAVSQIRLTGFFGRVSLFLPCFYACRSCLNNCNSVRLPPVLVYFGVSFHPPGFLLRLLSCAPSTLYSTWILFFFLVSFPWFWVSLSSFLLLSPLLEPSLLFFLLSVRSLLGAVAVTPPPKKNAKV